MSMLMSGHIGTDHNLASPGISSYLLNLCHDVTIFCHIEGVDFTGVSVQVVEKWGVVFMFAVVATAHYIRVDVWAQSTGERGRQTTLVAVNTSDQQRL